MAKGKNKLIGATKPEQFNIGQYVHIYEENSTMDESQPLKIIGKQLKTVGGMEYTLLQIIDCNEHTEWINTIYCKIIEYKPRETITDVARRIFKDHKPKVKKSNNNKGKRIKAVITPKIEDDTEGEASGIILQSLTKS